MAARCPQLVKMSVNGVWEVMEGGESPKEVNSVSAHVMAPAMITGLTWDICPVDWEREENVKVIEKSKLGNNMFKGLETIDEGEEEIEVICELCDGGQNCPGLMEEAPLEENSEEWKVQALSLIHI